MSDDGSEGSGAGSGPPRKRRRRRPRAGERSAERSPGERTAERSPGERTAERSPGERTAERSPGERTAERSPGERSAERSPGERNDGRPRDRSSSRARERRGNRQRPERKSSSEAASSHAERGRRTSQRSASSEAKRSERRAPREDASGSAAMERAQRPHEIRDEESYPSEHENEERYSSEHASDDESLATEPEIGPGDDDGPAPAIELSADLPPAPPVDDLDPLTWAPDDAEDGPEELADAVVNVVGVKFTGAGKIYLYDARDASYRRGEEVMVEAEREVRRGIVAVGSQRRPTPGRSLRPVLRRATPNDAAPEAASERGRAALVLAKDLARQQRLPLKVFRVEYATTGKKLTVYFTSDERIDFRQLVRDLAQRLGARIEMRQIGVRDEAKLVGGIGSCGQELCCTTWLPEFVPVSIKMAKDQGLVLNPTKVSGQCGRLKCCLVYEQATYAELRKGLPKLGKRVVTGEGREGRVVEVDVLHQRVRVALGPGESELLAAADVQPLFPSQAAAPRSGGKSQRGGKTARSEIATTDAPAPAQPAKAERDDEPPTS